MIIKLSKAELRDARRLAYQLAIHWYGIRKDKALLAQAITGVCGEMAVIKYFNETLGAEPQLKLNEDYKNGCDGGIDFRHPPDLSWDVKVITNGSKHVLKTKAQCVIGVERLEKNTYSIVGFAPVSRLRNSFTKDWYWIPIHFLKKLFPKHFPHEHIRKQKRSHPELIRKDLINVFLPIEWKYITEYEESKDATNP